MGTDGSRLYLTHSNTFSIEEVAVSGGEIETVPSHHTAESVLG